MRVHLASLMVGVVLGFLLATMAFQYRFEAHVDIHHHLHMEGLVKRK
jgi:hypothetical protein